MSVANTERILGIQEFSNNDTSGAFEDLPHGKGANYPLPPGTFFIEVVGESPAPDNECTYFADRFPNPLAVVLSRVAITKPHDDYVSIIYRHPSNLEVSVASFSPDNTGVISFLDELTRPIENFRPSYDLVLHGWHLPSKP